MKRVFDFIVSFLAIVLLSPLLIIIAILVKFSSPGPIIFWSKRIGIDGSYFLMPKFRSMNINAPQVASDKLTKPNQYITSFGKFIRRTSLDELPQLFSVVKGDMSLVGPRPALFNQEKLYKMRMANNVYNFLPGITGLAQINGRDHLSDEIKVSQDTIYCKNITLLNDLKILFLTSKKIFSKSDITH